MWHRSLPRLASAASRPPRHVVIAGPARRRTAASTEQRRLALLGVRCFGTAEVAPAVSALGLPQAVVVSASTAAHPRTGLSNAALSTAAPAGIAGQADTAEPRNLREAIDNLRGLQSKEDLTAEDVQPLARRSIELATGAPLPDLADLSDCFRALRVRIPLREMMPAVTDRIDDDTVRSDPASLSCVVRIMSNTGKGSLFYNELFEFCHERLGSIDAPNLAIYLYEAGRHGLRCRHFIDAAVGRATSLVPEMSLDELMMVAQGLIRFTRDWKQFYMAARPRMLAEVGKLSVPQLLLVLRSSRDMRYLPDFVALHAACSAELMWRVEKLSVNEAAACLMHCTFSPKFRAQAHGLVSSIVQKWNRTEDLSGLRVVEVVDALETFASWGMKPLPLTNRLCDLLVDRTVELKYAGNCSLWIMSTQSLARMDHLDASWPPVALELARDKPFVERASFFQQSTLIMALSKLRLFDEAVYNNVAELLLADFTLFREVKDLAPVLQAYTAASHYHPEFFDSAYDLVLEWLEGEQLDLSKRAVQANFIQVAWCLAQAGYHKRYESFSALLDHAFFTKFSELAPIHLRRLAQLADLVLEEEPAQAQNCQYFDRVKSVRSAPSVQRLLSSDPPSDAQLLQSLRNTLAELSWPADVFAAPTTGGDAACLLDVSLEAKFGQKVGLLIAGPNDLFRIGLPREAEAPRPAGTLALVQRLLATRGWRTVVISNSDWAPLKSTEDRRKFLEDRVQKALQEG